jgi:xanthine dehydrogenase/oxidase
MAIVDACEQINSRLAPLKAQFPDIPFKDLCEKAYLDRIDLSAHGFYKIPDIHFDLDKGRGRPWHYFT